MFEFESGAEQNEDVNEEVVETPAEESSTSEKETEETPEPEKKTDDKPGEEVKPEGEDLKKKNAGLVQELKKERRKRKTYKAEMENRLGKLEDEVITTRRERDVRAKVDKIAEKKGLDKEEANELYDELVGEGKNLPGSSSYRQEANKPAMVKDALESILDDNTELEPYKEEIKDSLDKSNNLALLTDEGALEYLADSIRGRHAQEIYSKGDKAQIEKKTKEKIAETVHSPSGAGAGGGGVEALTQEEKNWGASHGMTDADVTKLKKSRGSIPGVSPKK